MTFTPGLDPIEALKDPRSQLVVDRRSTIRYANRQSAINSIGGDDDATALWRVADGVVDEVFNNPSDEHRIEASAKVVANVELKAESAQLDHGSLMARHSMEKLAGIDVANVGSEQPLFELLDVEEVGDQGEGVLGQIAKVAHRAGGHRIGVGHNLAEQLKVSLNGGERVAQIVDNEGGEGTFFIGELTQPLIRSRKRPMLGLVKTEVDDAFVELGHTQRRTDRISAA